MDATAPRDDEPSGTTREEEGIGAFNRNRKTYNMILED
jgi:hypothetical protein